ncbi:hypothetical protein RIR_jg730.t1 [Rhizophagus irregularis DAOM 181602=DAOM 197198]|nr:hypothetical protein RIR_jg730.t1 [Rhizophagus irregularis DAOM 181602=DAOM 197198]
MFVSSLLIIGCDGLPNRITKEGMQASFGKLCRIRGDAWGFSTTHQIHRTYQTCHPIHAYTRLYRNNYKKQGRIDSDDRRLHANGRMNDIINSDQETAQGQGTSQYQGVVR